jgi:hypothetical protein
MKSFNPFQTTATAMEIDGPHPKQLKGIVKAWPAIDGRAFAIRLELTDSVIDLELDDERLRQLLMALMQSSVVCSQKRTDLPAIKGSDPAQGVQIPATAIDVVPMEESRKRLVMRVGTVDFHLMIGSSATAKSLAMALTA